MELKFGIFHSVFHTKKRLLHGVMGSLTFEKVLHECSAAGAVAALLARRPGSQHQEGHLGHDLGPRHCCWGPELNGR